MALEFKRNKLNVKDGSGDFVEIPVLGEQKTEKATVGELAIEVSRATAAEEAIAARVDKLQKVVGSPFVAATAASMTNTDRVYVYTGSETGYTAGNWYYYDGTAWVSGGVYNSAGVNVDDTLTYEGMAADAKATGDEFTNVKNAISQKAPLIINTASGDVASFADGADGMQIRKIVGTIVPVQSGTGDPSPTNIRSISGWTQANIVVSPTSDAEDGVTLPINWQTEAGTVYGGVITLNEDGSADLLITKAGKTISQLSGNPYISGNMLRWDGIGSLFAGFTYSGSYNPPNAISTMLRGVGDSPISGSDAYRSTFAFGRTIFWISDNTCATAEAYLQKYADCLIVWDLDAAHQQTYHFDNIGTLMTYFGANNVWIDTGAITECDYPADTKLYIDGLTEPDEDMIANANIASGKYFVVNNQLYLSTAAIAAGASIVPGTNCTATNIAEALNTINT